MNRYMNDRIGSTETMFNSFILYMEHGILINYLFLFCGTGYTFNFFLFLENKNKEYSYKFYSSFKRMRDRVYFLFESPCSYSMNRSLMNE